jgi:hypothetical protein
MKTHDPGHMPLNDAEHVDGTGCCSVKIAEVRHIHTPKSLNLTLHSIFVQLAAGNPDRIARDRRGTL